MNNYTGSSRGGRRAGILTAAAAGTALLAAACGSGGSSAATGSTAYQKALEFAQCVRTHGEPTWPDPTSGGTFSIGQIDINAPQYSTALKDCRSLDSSFLQIQLSTTQQQTLMRAALKEAACIRAHGIPNFPDPSVQEIKSQLGAVVFALGGTGLDPNSPFLQSAADACSKQLHNGTIAMSTNPQQPT
jgi:hypothetical protein